MIRFFLPIALLLLANLGLQAQTPKNIAISGSTDGNFRVPCNLNDAGTIQSFGPLSGQSNDIDLDTIYLCLGDTLRLTHNMDFSFGGDPDVATASGIAYAFYDDIPTVDGPDLNAVLADSSLNTTSPLILNGFEFPQDNGIWLASTINSFGNLDLINDGNLQIAYNMGVPEPIQFWFAPITVDNAAALEYEGTPSGPCVSVSIDEAFSVVYLESIEMTESFISQNGGLEGSFVVQGGLPEFDPSTSYTVTINEIDGGAAGTVQTVNPGHNDTISYTVPETGIYEVIVEDGKSCGLIDTVIMPVLFDVGDLNGAPGDTICVPVNTTNFVNLTNAQFSMAWDPTLLDFIGVDNLTTDLPSFDQGIFNLSPAITDTGRLTMGWADFLGSSWTLSDGALLFEVCFEVTGNLGDAASVDIIGSPLNIQIGNANSGNANLPTIIDNGQVNITNAILLVEGTVDSVSCAGFDDGSFTVTTTGGVPPYTYAWNDVPPAGPDNTGTIAASGDSFTATDLAEGVYSITVSDSDMPANIDTIMLQVLEGPALGLSLIETQPTCNGDDDGSLTAQITLDGVAQPNPGPGFTFSWNTGDSTRTITGLSFQPQAYAVTVTDENGCIASASTTLSQPGELLLLAQNTNITDATCSGAMDGTITVGASGGVNDMGDYYYEWEGQAIDTAATAQLTNLDPGIYNLTVTDANGCFVIDSFQVGATKLLGVTLVDSSHVSCNGADDAFLQVQGTATGQPPFGAFTYDWTALPGGQNFSGDNINNLAPGQYVVTVTDQDPLGCFTVASYDIGEPDSLQVQLVDFNNESCTGGGMDGAITVGVEGGTAPYTYAWSNMATDSILTGLVQGLYILDLEDANGCMVTDTFAVTAPNPPVIVSFENDTLLCAGDSNGSLMITATPSGSPIESYTWSNNETGPAIANLTPDTYFVTITAEDGCELVASAQVVAPEPLVIDSISSVSPLCVGQSNGSLTVFASGGTQPYRYIWGTDTLSTVLYPGLSAGLYNLTVTDANGCAGVTATVEVADPSGIEISFADISPVSCFEGVCDGQATATAMYADGSTGLFNFNWESGEIDLDVLASTAAQLCRDSQTVVVTDENGCVQTSEVIIPSPEPISLNPASTSVSCNGGSNGSITLSPTGGTGGYTYLWPDLNQMTAAVSELMAGEYNVIVTDANGCEQDGLPEIDEPDALELNIDPVNTRDISCFGEEDGQIAVTYNFNDNINAVGDMPFSFSSNFPQGAGNAATGFASGLTAGAYGITITDSRGCQDSVSIQLLEPSEIMAIIPDPEDPLCFDATTLLFIDTVFGGAGTTPDDYRYMVDGNGVLLTPDIPADIFGDGEHSIEIFDPNGCSAAFFVEIDQPDEITVTFPEQVIEIELGDSTTRLMPIISPAGTQVDSFIWTPSTFLSSDTVESPTVFPLESLDYTLRIVDVNGCDAEGSVFVELDANRNIFIPGAFSPNGDGTNDEFRIFPCTGVTSIGSVNIYDRWGNQVYRTGGFDVNNGLFCVGGLPLWDGSFKGEFMNMGVYVYVIEVEFLDGFRLVYRGDLSLVR
jgi:gliding motility-associated-like protein